MGFYCIKNFIHFIKKVFTSLIDNKGTFVIVFISYNTLFLSNTFKNYISNKVLQMNF